MSLVAVARELVIALVARAAMARVDSEEVMGTSLGDPVPELGVLGWCLLC